MITPANTALLIVDIQERLLPALHEHQAFLTACRQFITGANLLGVPHIITEQYPKGLGATVPDIALLTPDAPKFSKTQFSAYTAEVAAALQSRQPENIVLIGCETHICMLQTVLDLRQQGYNVFIPQECATSRTAANKANGLQQIQAAGGIVSNIESLLFMLLKDAQHPQFKAISKLIV
ncbi:isochorismatase family protein [Kingella sp. (in: b-proteobacteria)]|uniref:isochorismatase family protein n=1 Tax=Kingella sp. (in: b-proteobacteria) TaxID=2020713 RepID=UPI0026DB845E|nr:isochorismatase family protein [Kingella sp. (in: b-proteobacteria)]MDO4657781.1 isochorismatase family protein [Kingella sp. (in: b-proteobacteria)]